MSVTSVYQKMMREGKLNTPIKIAQPTPKNESGRNGELSPYKHVKEETPNNNKENIKKQLIEQKVIKLEKRIKSIEGSLQIIMDAQIKLMGQ